MKIFFDTEFIEDGKTIDLISIGFVREDGQTLYMESSECDLSKADTWVHNNVISKLDSARGVWENSFMRDEIARKIVEFAGSKPEFWAYYADYDWVVLCQLYGRMLDIPKGWPHFCLDFKQFLHSHGLNATKIEEHEAHNALADALWLKREHDALWSRSKRAVCMTHYDHGD